jgi:hypothetical protein
MNMQLGAGLTLAWILAFGFWGGLHGACNIPQVDPVDISSVTESSA